MNILNFGRIAGAVALTIGLAGCFDMTTDVTITSETEGSATVTQVMGKDIYAMIKSDSSAEWCNAEGAVKTEDADGGATCVTTSTGAFADLKFDDGGAKPVFTVVSPGVVRVAVQTEGMMGESGAEAAATMKDMFEGRALTIRFGGKKVTDTNLTLNPEGTAAEIVIPFIDILGGTAELPTELYAVIDTN